MTEDKMVGWHHRHNGHEFEQAPGDGEGQEGLACCSPWGHKESDTTEQLNNNKNDLWSHHFHLFWLPQPVSFHSSSLWPHFPETSPMSQSYCLSHRLSAPSGYISGKVSVYISYFLNTFLTLLIYLFNKGEICHRLRLWQIAICSYNKCCVSIKQYFFFVTTFSMVGNAEFPLRM